MRTLVLFTALVAILAGAAIVQWGRLNPLLPPETTTTTLGIGATIGSPDAPVDLLIIEDFLCPSCRQFHQKYFAQIQEEYVKTGKARYTMVPIPVVRGSGILENAALAIYQQNPDLFFPYVEKIFQEFRRAPKKGVAEKRLIELAQELGGVNEELLQRCIDTRCNRDLLQRNLDWAHRRMGPQFVLPALYMDGKPATMEQVEEALR